MAEPDFLAATRASYDAVAAEYGEYFREELKAMPLERAMLRAFAELVAAGGGGPVADLGCGPGHATALLSTWGVEAFGVDLSPEMVALARREHPALRFEVGSMTALDCPEGSLGGIVAFYSTIHLPEELLPEVFAGFHRALAPAGLLLVVFQLAEGRDGGLHLDAAFGESIALDYHWRRPERMAEVLTGAGFTPEGRLRIEPDEQVPRPRACMLLRAQG